MDILDKIVVDKRREVAAKESLFPLQFLKESPLYNREAFSLAASVKTKSGIIAEFKRRSPSKHVINHLSSVIDVTKGYEEAGVSGISVLTDTKYFGGAIDDLIQVRKSVNIPVLRKEFIIDTYQIHEAKAYGADAVLLIAAILTEAEICLFSEEAKKLGMDVLLEVHNIAELKKFDLSYVDLLGVNNRNLKTFEVSLETSKQLSALIPEDKVKISESGISSINSIKELQGYGFKGFLIGENFMKTKDPGKAAKKFIMELGYED